MATPDGPRVMVIGLDAADPALLRRWVAGGHMPHLARLMARGVSGRLRTPPGMADDAVWSSFSTGVWPADHGRFHYLARLPGHYGPIRFRNDLYVHPPFWAVLDRAGHRCVVLDVPKSPQADPVHGIEINNFRVHGVDGGLVSRPPAIAQELARRYAADPTDRPDSDHFLCAPVPFHPGERGRFVDLIRQSVLDKTRVALDLLATGCDLFLAVFKESHCAGHKLWPPGPDMLAVYAELDGAVGQLVRQAGEQTTLIVFSSLGMAANEHGNRFVDPILRRIERHLLPFRVNLQIDCDRQVCRLRRRLGLASPGPGLGNRLAFAIPHNEISAAIRINLAGREPAGRVQPGTAYHALCARIETEMRALRDAGTGEPVVRDVVRIDRELGGTRRDCLPDLLVVWRRGAPIAAISSPTLGTMRRPPGEDSPGNHVEDGFFVAVGPGTQASPSRGPETATADIVDLAPTIVAIFGGDLPAAAGPALPSILQAAGWERPAQGSIK